MANDMANTKEADMARREYGTGSAYQRTSDWRWIAAINDGFTASGSRKRIVVTGKGCEGGCPKRCPHRAAINRKLEQAKGAKQRGESTSSRMTVKQWADEYATIRLADLAPKAWNAAMSPIRRWVIPTVGHKRLGQLTPSDIRAVATKQRDAGRKPGATHRAMMTMLRTAVTEGHQVPASVLAVKPPKSGKSDRTAMSIDEGLACLKVAAELPHGTRWLVTLLYGMRMGECLGLTWDCVDFDAGEIRIEWQLQALPYLDRKDKARGFRVPDGYEARHLVDAFHLVRPKSKSGWRVAPMLPAVRDGLLRWREMAPENPWGLVWPNAKGRPANDKHDRAEWWGLQNVAEVGHPAGRPYHVHECRNFAATMLGEAGVEEHVITALLGHSTVVMSRKYMTVRREPLLDAMTRVGELLQLNGQANS